MVANCTFLRASLAVTLPPSQHVEAMSQSHVADGLLPDHDLTLVRHQQHVKIRSVS